MQIASHMPSLSEMGAPANIIAAPVISQPRAPVVQQELGLRAKPDPRPAMNGASGGPWVLQVSFFILSKYLQEIKRGITYKRFEKLKSVDFGVLPMF